MSTSKSDVRSRGWCFTVNNYTSEDESQVLAMAQMASYIVVGKEIGEKCGTPHYQGYVYFPDAKSFSKMKKLVPRANLRVPNGTPEQNRNYCTKQTPGFSDGMLIEQGKLPSPGKRSDIDTTREILRNGGNIRQVIDVATSYQSIRVAQEWLKYNEKPRDFKPEIRWFHGSTGAGKTQAAKEWLESFGSGYYTPVSFKWWEGYDAHENVLLDEIRGDFCKYHEMLKLLDRYQYKVECKNGSRQFLAKRIAITSPFSPYDLWPTHEDKRQLTRRLDSVIQLGESVDVYSVSLKDERSDSDSEDDMAPKRPTTPVSMNDLLSEDDPRRV